MSRSKIFTPDSRRRMIKTEEGRFRATSIIKFINNFGGLMENSRQDLIKHSMMYSSQSRQSQEKIVNQIELIPLDEDEDKRITPPLRITNAF